MIVNLTQHQATPAQVAAGVRDLPRAKRVYLTRLLTFDDVPSPSELVLRAYKIAELAMAAKTRHVMIGGAPYFMSYLEDALRGRGITPLYAFSIRKSAEELLDNGTVKKSQVFEHAGFVEARR